MVKVVRVELVCDLCGAEIPQHSPDRLVVLQGEDGEKRLDFCDLSHMLEYFQHFQQEAEKRDKA